MVPVWKWWIQICGMHTSDICMMLQMKGITELDAMSKNIKNIKNNISQFQTKIHTLQDLFSIRTIISPEKFVNRSHWQIKLVKRNLSRDNRPYRLFTFDPIASFSCGISPHVSCTIHLRIGLWLGSRSKSNIFVQETWDVAFVRRPAVLKQANMETRPLGQKWINGKVYCWPVHTSKFLWPENLLVCTRLYLKFRVISTLCGGPIYFNVFLQY